MSLQRCLPIFCFAVIACAGAAASSVVRAGDTQLTATFASRIAAAEENSNEQRQKGSGEHNDVDDIGNVMPDLREKSVDVGASPPVEPPDYRLDNYRTPVPATLSGARVITGEEAVDLWRRNAAIFIDVYPRAPKPAKLPAGTIWRDHPHQTIENAVWLPNVGYGRLSPDVDAAFRQHLKELTEDDSSQAIVFFCLRNCWMSWNAAKRAIHYGYSNVIWFPEGTDVWQELGQLVVNAQPRELADVRDTSNASEGASGSDAKASPP